MHGSAQRKDRGDSMSKVVVGVFCSLLGLFPFLVLFDVVYVRFACLPTATFWKERHASCTLSNWFGFWVLWRLDGRYCPATKD